MSCILSAHHGIKLEINKKRNNNKYTNTWSLNDTVLNDQWITEELRGVQQIPRSKWKLKHSIPEYTVYNESSSKEVSL
jgi:hypothetical protein